MYLPKLLRFFLIASISLLTFGSLRAQETIYGTVYDSTQNYPLAGVSVMGSSGVGTITDSLGHYEIKLPSSDSIYFSYLGKSTSKFPIKTVPLGNAFDISLQVEVISLPSVLVRPRNYEADSLENRHEYQKIFDYGGAGYLNNAKMNRRGGFGVGIDFDMLLNPRRERRMLAFQERLIQEEQDKYIDHRFSKALVKKLTGIQPPILDSFMHLFRPSYSFLQSFETDYEYYRYISNCGKSFLDMWRYDHPNDSTYKYSK